jgi:DTW domain-containing protein YfiP
MNATDSIENEGESFRQECYDCFRAASVCICHRFERKVQNQTGVIVLQHHREVTHPIGTARIARLGLETVEVRIAHRHNGLAVAESVPARTALLYPSSKAKTLDDLGAQQMPEHLIVLDGTWSQAMAMYKSNLWLSELPHVIVKPQEESNYRIRRQPKSGCLSTIEALVQTLKVIEPQTEGMDGLSKIFSDMIDDQMAREQAAREAKIS